MGQKEPFEKMASQNSECGGLLGVLCARRSVRQYQDRPIPPEVLKRILEAGRIAPSARNVQEWRFVVVQKEETRKRLVPACAGQSFVAQAPCVLACCATLTDYVMRCGQLAYPIDVAIAIDHMVLQATAEGIGSCWIGAFYEDQVKEILGIPQEVRVVEMLTLGYPVEPLLPIPPDKKKRKPLVEIVCWETWSEKPAETDKPPSA